MLVFEWIFLVVFHLAIALSTAEIRVPNGKQFEGQRKINPQEKTAEYWHNIARNFLEKARSKKPITNVAKNVILFLGDGMSVSTITAARIYAGGESYELSFEKFPYTAVSKTYCLDFQVSESASTATAYLGGVKANYYTSGLTGAVPRYDCEGSLLPENHVPSIAAWSQKNDKWTGFVTTTRITHASPAGLYSHTAHKLWECDTDISKDKKDPEMCPDIAKQLVHGETGRNFHVILGCGRNKFIPKEEKDEEGQPGQRSDKKNLIHEWQDQKKKNNEAYEYIWNRKQLLDVRNETDYLFGLFDNDMCKYNVDKDATMDPTLEEMTEAAITKLQKSPKGFFLFVEGGNIDQAHHRTLAGKALDETNEFAKAIRRAVELTDEEETLIVVTSDHSHTMVIGGYPKRGSDVLGLTKFAEILPMKDPIPIISYANGPGQETVVDGVAHNFSEDKIDMNYRYPMIHKLLMETHAGEDILIYARGPWAHLFEGVMEQSTIPHIMGYASCVGQGPTACQDGATLYKSASWRISFSFLMVFCNIIFIFSQIFVNN